MMRSLYAGISGLRNFQTKMDIIGNNIANVNTVAFKGSRITFAETLSQTLSGEIAATEGQGGVNIMQVGLGMRTLGVDTNFNQGSLESTGVTTDLAVQGEGFFMVSDGAQTYYTRAGAFHLDADGFLVNGGGHRVQGYGLSELNLEPDRTALRSLQIPIGRRSQARASASVELMGNLDMNLTQSTAQLVDAGTTGIANLNGTASDGVGGRHEVRITGQNATRSSASGATQGLNLTDSLAQHNVSFTGFSINVDDAHTVDINGLTAESTIADLINAINSQVNGVQADLDNNGAIRLVRTHYGDGGVYNVVLTDDQDAGADGIVVNLFNAQGPFEVNNGTASTLAAVDYFTPSDSNTVLQRTLELTMDENTGLVNGISKLGGSGVSISAPPGLAAGTAIINTEDTTQSASIFVYDSLGNTHNLTATFTKTERPGVWRWEVDLPSPAVVVEGGKGEISFGADGSLESFTYENNLSALTFNPGNGAENLTLSLDAGTVGAMDGITQTSAASSLLATKQDGYGMGTLQDIFIDSTGNIFGSFSNGVSENLAQVLLANFTNPQGLERMGDNLYRESANSGAARIASADQTGAQINSGYLEMSNVDLSREFTDMIVAQRAFQAAARVIVTSDGLLDEVTRLKR